MGNVLDRDHGCQSSSLTGWNFVAWVIRGPLPAGLARASVRSASTRQRPEDQRAVGDRVGAVILKPKPNRFASKHLGQRQNAARDDDRAVAANSVDLPVVAVLR